MPIKYLFPNRYEVLWIKCVEGQIDTHFTIVLSLCALCVTKALIG